MASKYYTFDPTIYYNYGEDKRFKEITKEQFLRKAKQKYKYADGRKFSQEKAIIAITRDDDFVVIEDENQWSSYFVSNSYCEVFILDSDKKKIKYIADLIGESESDFILHYKIAINKQSNAYKIVETCRSKRNNKVFLCILLVVSLLLVFALSGKDSNKWESLSDEEKEWYEDNYGDGKSEAIDEAIEDYSNN